MSDKSLASILEEFQKKILESIETDKNNNQNIDNNFNFDDLYISLDTINDNIVGLKETLKVKKPEVNSNIVKINVGGTLFATLKSTFSKKSDNESNSENLFEEYLNGKQVANYDENKAIFIDRDPKHFFIILEYLRKINTTQDISLKNYTDEELIDLLAEVQFYKLVGLKRLIYLENLPSNVLGLSFIDRFFKVSNFLFERKKLLYRASRDGFGADVFHSKCDGEYNTITIIKTEKSFIFGGYAYVKWKAENPYHSLSQQYKADQYAYAFTLSNNLGTPLQYKCHNIKEAILASTSNGPSFKHYFQISTNSNANKNSYSSFGYGAQASNKETDIRAASDTVFLQSRLISQSLKLKSFL